MGLQKQVNVSFFYTFASAHFCFAFWTIFGNARSRSRITSRDELTSASLLYDHRTTLQRYPDLEEAIYRGKSVPYDGAVNRNLDGRR